MNGLIDFDFKLAENEDIHEHYTRHRRDLHLPRAKTNKGKQRPLYQASTDFNNLEHEVKNATSSYNFKKPIEKTVCIRGINLSSFSSNTILILPLISSLSAFLCFPLQTMDDFMALKQDVRCVSF